MPLVGRKRSQQSCAFFGKIDALAKGWRCNKLLSYEMKATWFTQTKLRKNGFAVKTWPYSHFSLNVWYCIKYKALYNIIQTGKSYFYGEARADTLCEGSQGASKSTMAATVGHCAACWGLSLSTSAAASARWYVIFGHQPL